MKLARLLTRARFNSRDHLAIIALSYEIKKTEAPGSGISVMKIVFMQIMNSHTFQTSLDLA